MQELLALLDAGPPPLSALALNRCDLTESSVSALAAACPNLEVSACLYYHGAVNV